MTDELMWLFYFISITMRESEIEREKVKNEFGNNYSILIYIYMGNIFMNLYI